MAKARPELEQVKTEITANPRSKAHEIAEKTGIIETMGYDSAVDYVRSVKKRMRKNGELAKAIENMETDIDQQRLEDINKLIELRKGKMSKKAAYHLLLLNCYYRMRSKDDNTNWTAIDHTYELNDNLSSPFTRTEAIHICEIAMDRYMDSIDPKKTEEARSKGFPHAGFNYSPETLYFKLDVKETELPHLQTIKLPQWY